MADAFQYEETQLESPANHAAAVTPSDSVDLTNFARALYVGSGGDVKVTTTGGDTVVFANVPDGAVLPVRVKRVFATLTTADDIVAVW